MDIVKFDKNIKNSYFFEKNFNGIWSVSTINENMIEVDYLKEFHYQVSLILHLYSSLYIRLKRKEDDFSYNVNKFSDLVNNLNIRISDDNSKDKILGEFVEERTFIFYYKTFERYQSNAKEMYEEGNNDNPVFGYFDNKQCSMSEYIRNMIPSEIINMNLSRININNLVNFRNKFNEIIGNILKQTPENMMGYLLYQKLNMNIILFNINIQNYVRYKYLNNGDNTYISLQEDNTKLNKIIDEIRKLIKDRANQIRLLNSNNFANNDYLLEKNRYKDKINALDNVKANYVKINDRYNLTMKKLKNNVKTYDKLRIFSYMIIGFIIILMIIFSILIYTRRIRYLYFLIILVILIIIGYLYYLTFNYINEKFVSGSSSSPSTPALLNPNTIVINSRDITILFRNNYYYINSIAFNDDIFFNTIENKIRIQITNTRPIVNAEIYAIIGKAYLGLNYLNIQKTDIIENSFIPEYDTDKINYFYNSTNYKNYKKIVFDDVLRNNSFYSINPEYIRINNPKIDRTNFVRSIPYIKLHLEFSGGQSINTNINVKPPIVMVLLQNIKISSSSLRIIKNNNTYIIKEIYIFNGGSYYKNLPNSALLRTIRKNGISLFVNRDTNPINFNIFIFNINFLNLRQVFSHIADIEYVNKGLYENDIINIETSIISRALSNISVNPFSLSVIKNIVINIKNIVINIKNLSIYIYNVLLNNLIFDRIEEQISFFNNYIYNYLNIINNTYDIILENIFNILKEPTSNLSEENNNIIYENFINYINKFITIFSFKYKTKLKHDIIELLDNLKLNYQRREDELFVINNEITRIENYIIREEPFNSCFNANGNFICDTNNLIEEINLIRNKLEELELLKTNLYQSTPVEDIYLRTLFIKEELLDKTKHLLTLEQRNNVQIYYNNIINIKNNYIYNCYFNNRCVYDRVYYLDYYIKNLVKIYAEVFYDEIRIINDTIKVHYNISQRLADFNNEINSIIIRFGNNYSLSSLIINLNDNNNTAQGYLDTSLNIKTTLLSDNFMDNLQNNLNTLINNKTRINVIQLNTVKIPLILDKVDNSLDLYITSIEKFEKIKDLGLNDAIQLEIDKIKLNIYGGDNGNTNETINCGSGASTITNNMKALLMTIIGKLEDYLNGYNLDGITTNYRDVGCYNIEVENKITRILSLIDTIRIFNSNNGLREFDARSNVHLQIHSRFYNELNRDISDYITHTNNLLKNMSKNVYTIGSKTFIMDENNYLYDIYLKQKKEVENLKVKFNKNLINDDDVDKNKNFLYNLVFSIIVLCIIILIAINIHLYVYKSFVLNAILVIFLMIFLIITNVFKIVQPTRMDNDKFYWFKFKKVQS